MEDRPERGDGVDPGDARKVSRRGFLTSMGGGALGVVVGSQVQPAAAAAAQVVDAGEMLRVTLRINGVIHNLLVEPRWSLAYVLREVLGLTGTKIGCDRGECGGCTVLLDDLPRYSCLTLAVEAEGKEVTTVEGLMDGEELGPVQAAFVEEDGMQCGYCTPGQIMAVEGLLRRNAAPTPEEAREATSGNLCRCGAYPHILRSALRGAELKREEGGAS